MATIYVNDQTSSSTDVANGQPIDQSDTYTILIDNNYTNSLYANVYFLNSMGQYDWDESYHEKSITTYSYWTNKGWTGPYTDDKVEYGSVEFGDAGPDTYGTLSAIKGVFTEVPSSVCAICVEYYDGTSWSEKYYWTFKSSSEHYAVRCYIDGSWHNCAVKCYDGAKWIDCALEYHNGSQWQDCLF